MEKSRSLLLKKIQQLEDTIQNLSNENKKLQHRNTALSKTEPFQQDLLDLLPEIICYVDENHRYRQVNKAFLNFFKVSPTTVIGKHPKRILGSELYSQLELQQKLALAGEKQDFETTLQMVGGEQKIFHARYFPARNGEKIEGFLAIITDITEKKKTEEALKKSEAQYRRLIDNLPGTAFQYVLTPDGDSLFTFIGEKVFDLFGYSAKEIREDAQKIFNAIPPPDSDCVDKAIQESASQLSQYQVDHKVIKKSGETIWVHSSSIPRRSNDGHIIWDGIALDITQRKRAENELISSLEELQLHERISKLFLTSGIEELFHELLLLLLKTFNCRYGYIGYIDDDGNLNCPSMTREVWDECNIQDKNNIFPRTSWGGKWGESLLEQKTVLHNNILNTPKGHIRLHNTLIVPLIVDNSLTGQIALANKKEYFSLKDKLRLESLAKFMAPLFKIYLERDHMNEELERSVLKLEQQNIALNILIENRDLNKEKVARNVIDNFDKLVFPYFEKLSRFRKRDDILTVVEIIAKNSKESLKLLDESFDQTYKSFSPKEIQVADLIKAGKSSKQIAEILNISPRSVFFHRNNIRKKLNIQKEKINLRAHLLAL